ncbi:MAG: amidohydrolase, partial [Firmicutes bacterium]|nr:amidohydrolase [Bacillota bacterium]
MILIKNGTIYTMENDQVLNGDILINDGKIVEVGENIAVPEGAEVIDATGKLVFPGFIDAHDHLGLSEE